MRLLVLPNSRLVLPHHRGALVTCGNVIFNPDPSTSYAAKVVEVLHPCDEYRRKRLHNESNAYQLLEEAYTSGKRHSRIAPQCYGVYKLVQDLHSIGIIHGDLKPCNIVRVHGCGFRLIGFSWSHNLNGMLAMKAR